MVAICPRIRSGRIRLNLAGPPAWIACMLLRSSPSVLGVVRARYTPMAIRSWGVKCVGVIPRAGNSAGMSVGVLLTWSTHALIPAA